MNIKIAPFLIVISFLFIKFILLINKSNITDIFTWITVGLIWLWIAWAYWRDKSMPAIYGSFHYKNAENNFIRSFYVISISLLFFGIIINDLNIYLTK